MHHITRALVIGSLVFTPTGRAHAAKSASDRRDFVKGFVALGAVGGGMGSAVVATKAFEVVARPEQTGPSYTRTVLEQHLYLIGEVVTTRLLSRVYGEGTFGNAGMTDEKIKEMLKDPVSLWMNLSVVAPVIEENLFRLFPAVLFGTGWVTGTLSAGVFAAMHGLDKIPLGQFTGGIWYWYLMKYRGISHAMLAHAANNHVAAVALMIANRLKESPSLKEAKCAEPLTRRPDGPAPVEPGIERSAAL